MPTEQPIPAEFLAQYDAERARRLRRRAVWYSVTILVLVAISWSTTVYELAVGTAFTGGDTTSRADILTDTLFTAIFGGALFYFARRPRSRPEIVHAFQWVLAVSGVTAVAVTPLVMNASWIPGATLDRTPETDFAQAIASLLTVFVLHFLASVFVALSPREGLAPLLPVLAAFAAWVVFVSVGDWDQRVTLILLSPLAGLPGFAWSWWRYRSFTDRFHARAVQKRYAEVSRELTDARRVHEALFPPPVTRGPFRLHYRYEPMREIGGDFLFVRPLSFPPAPASGPLLVVLIDITGHGIAAALAVNRIHAELEHLCAEGHLPEPASVIQSLNAFIFSTLSAQSIFASAVCFRLVPGATPEAALQWSGAGHPPAYLRRAAGDIERLDSTAPMLGILEPELYECEQRTLPLRPGDVLVAVTDGVTEAADDEGNQLGIDGAERLLVSFERARSAADQLAAAVESHRDGPPADDTLVVEILLAAEG